MSKRPRIQSNQPSETHVRIEDSTLVNDFHTLIMRGIRGEINQKNLINYIDEYTLIHYRIISFMHNLGNIIFGRLSEIDENSVKHDYYALNEEYSNPHQYLLKHGIKVKTQIAIDRNHKNVSIPKVITTPEKLSAFDQTHIDILIGLMAKVYVTVANPKLLKLI